MNKTGTQKKTKTKTRIHKLAPSNFPSPLCRFCATIIEDDFHLIIGCTFKRMAWLRALQELELVHRFPSNRQVWQFLLFAEKDALKRRQFQSFAIPIGLILKAVWPRHWQCVMDAIDGLWKCASPSCARNASLWV
jgi:hypothetical protein